MLVGEASGVEQDGSDAGSMPAGESYNPSTSASVVGPVGIEPTT